MYRFSQKKKRGLTLPELMIGISIFVFVGVILVGTTFAVALQVRRTLQEIPAEEQSYRAVDFMRQQLLAATESSLTVSNEGRTIQFVNPRVGGASRITLNTELNQIEYYRLANDAAPTRTYGRTVDINIQPLEGNGRLLISATSIANTGRGETLTFTHADEIRVRN